MKRYFFLLLALALEAAQAQFPPMFVGGMPGMAQFQAMLMQRHQARTLLYREALEELRKNPQAADVPACPAGSAPQGGECLVQARRETQVTPAARPEAEKAPAAPAPAASPGGRRKALLIGLKDYPAPIPPLDTPLADVDRIAALLRERFGFETQVLHNVGKEVIVAALNRLAGEARPEDRVLIFYAGHGYQMDDTGMGYWIPIDASVKTAKGWLSNDDIARVLAAISARQILLVSDSCFSGSLAKGGKIQAENRLAPEEVLRRRSVLVLTSGDEEPVADEGKGGHSIFAWNLIRALEKTGALTPGYEVWRSVHQGVTREYPQTPQYGKIAAAGHQEGGEYLLERGTNP